MKRTLLLAALSLLFFTACSESPGTAPNTPDAGDAGDTPDSGLPDLGTPILERPGTTDYSCTEVRAPIGALGPAWYPLGLVEAGGEAWLLRSDMGVKLSKLASDGTQSGEVNLGGSEYGSFGAAMASDGKALTMVWGEQLESSQQYRTAVVRLDGSIEVAAAPLEGTSTSSVSPPQLVPTPDGRYRLVWMRVDGGGANSVVSGILDGGAFVGAPIKLADAGAGYGVHVIGAVADDAGFAAAWGVMTNDGTTFTTEVWFGTFDTNGAPRHPARRISGPGDPNTTSGSTWLAGSSALLRVDDRYLVAFTVDKAPPDFNQLGHAEVHIAAVNERGEGSLSPLHAPVEGHISTVASFYRLGDAVGLFWAEGTIIRICAGCFVDYDLRTVLLDANTLSPVSAPATHSHQDHGFNVPRVVALGGDVLSVSLQDFHALSRPATALMLCSKTQ
jgi:hypothetical protein